jgi:hypothetical protein
MPVAQELLDGVDLALLAMDRDQKLVLELDEVEKVSTAIGSLTLNTNQQTGAIHVKPAQVSQLTDLAAKLKALESSVSDKFKASHSSRLQDLWAVLDKASEEAMAAVRSRFVLLLCDTALKKVVSHILKSMGGPGTIIPLKKAQDALDGIYVEGLQDAKSICLHKFAKQADLDAHSLWYESQRSLVLNIRNALTPLFDLILKKPSQPLPKILSNSALQCVVEAFRQDVATPIFEELNGRQVFQEFVSVLRGAVSTKAQSWLRELVAPGSTAMAILVTMEETHQTGTQDVFDDCDFEVLLLGAKTPTGPSIAWTADFAAELHQLLKVEAWTCSGAAKVMSMPVKTGSSGEEATSLKVTAPDLGMAIAAVHVMSKFYNAADDAAALQSLAFIESDKDNQLPGSTLNVAIQAYGAKLKEVDVKRQARHLNYNKTKTEV